MPHILTIIALSLFSFFSIMGDAAQAAGTDDGSSAAAVDYPAVKAMVDAGKYSDAVPLLAAMTKADPKNADAWNLLGYSNRKLKNYDVAAAAYETALSINPGHLGALEYQGEMYLETGKGDLAKANLAKLKDLCGDCEEYEDLDKAVSAAGV